MIGQMAPCIAAPNATHSRKAYAVFAGYHRRTSPVSKNGSRRFRGQLSVAVPMPLAGRSVHHGVLTVGARIAVIKITRRVIQVVPVSMTHHWPFRRWRTQKCFRDQAMKIPRFWLPVDANRHLQTAIGIDERRQDTRLTVAAVRDGATNAAKARRGIIRCAWDWPPLFGFLHTCQCRRNPALPQGLAA